MYFFSKAARLKKASNICASLKTVAVSAVYFSPFLPLLLFCCCLWVFDFNLMAGTSVLNREMWVEDP